MPRHLQNAGVKGSQKWLQVCTQHYPDSLQIGAQPVEWLSPLQSDDFAEYQDNSFLDVLGLSHLNEALEAFWPKRGPVWDGLGRVGKTVFLVEAKAHIAEFFSPATQAKPKSRKKIDMALAAVHCDLNAKDRADWSETFFQYTNRIAHLWFLRQQKINAKLVFISFINDQEMSGPATPSEWEACFRTADFALGLPSKHKLSRHIIHLHPDVAEIKHRLGQVSGA